VVDADDAGVLLVQATLANGKLAAAGFVEFSLHVSFTTVAAELALLDVFITLLIGTSGITGIETGSCSFLLTSVLLIIAFNLSGSSSK